MVITIPIEADDVELIRVSRTNPGFRVERVADGTMVMSPTRTKTGRKSGKAFRQLDEYADVVGGAAFDSSTGFAIGLKADVRSPNAAWLSQPRVDALEAEEADGFWPRSPDVVIEVESDAFAHAIAAVDRFMAGGSLYGVAIDPDTRNVIERGTPPAGLTLRLDEIIDA